MVAGQTVYWRDIEVVNIIRTPQYSGSETAISF